MRILVNRAFVGNKLLEFEINQISYTRKEDLCFISSDKSPCCDESGLSRDQEI